MLKNESEWIKEQLEKTPIHELSPMINLGSGTADFRNKRQPFINDAIIGPLKDRGVEIINSDMKAGRGVDIEGDVFDDEVRERLVSKRARAVLCQNMLEHVRRPRELARVCESVIQPGGRIFATVPKDFPYHPDPIDTMFRPSIKELEQMFPECEVIAGEVVVCETLGQQLMSSVRRFVGLLFHLIVPFPSMSHWRSAWARLRWIFRPYKITCVVLRKR